MIFMDFHKIWQITCNTKCINKSNIQESHLTSYSIYSIDMLHTHDCLSCIYKVLIKVDSILLLLSKYFSVSKYLK